MTNVQYWTGWGLVGLVFLIVTLALLWQLHCLDVTLRAVLQALEKR